jgi:hypothetical protein
VFGSWGATLALLICIRTFCIWSRGVFLSTVVDWFYGGGAGAFGLRSGNSNMIPVEERGDMVFTTANDCFLVMQ